SDGLKCDIRSLLKDLELQAAAEPGQTQPEPGSTEPLRLAPQARIRSRYRPGRGRGHLTIEPVSAVRSPWDERFTGLPSAADGLEEQLQKEQADREWRFQDRLRERWALPICEARPRLLEAIRRSRVTLVAAETGSGKSTQVPQYLLDDAIARGRGSTCHIVCTQPRRLAAVSLASRVAWERGERAGDASVGYVVRWDERPSRPWGSMVFCTVGALLPRLSRLGASHIIVDEAHTRDIHTDLLLTVLLELLSLSEDLKVIVMSATLDVSKWQRHFGAFGCELVQAGGRPYQVDQYFLEDIIEKLRWRPDAGGEPETLGVWSDIDCNRGFVDQLGQFRPETVNVVRSLPESMIPFHLLASIIKWVDSWDKAGSVLVFLPGWHEIAVCSSFLHRDPQLRHLEFVPLHSSVPPSEQQRAFQPANSGCRKVVLGTDIAETSITIPDILCVIDSGLARIKKHTNLEVVWASQANLQQRAGRAGRVQQGICVHLLTRSRFQLLDSEPTPEMQRVPLDEAVLALCELRLDWCKVDPADLQAWGSSAYVMTFLKKAPDPPPQKEVRNAFRELQHVGALDWEGYLTHLGALLVRLPVAPALGAALFM
ncbi:DHX9, partial [Symbiodinium sp. CCMP2456]